MVVRLKDGVLYSSRCALTKIIADYAQDQFLYIVKKSQFVLAF